MFFFLLILLLLLSLKMHYLDHLLKCPIGPSLKVLQLRRLFDWTNMAAALPQFFGTARHPCIEVSGRYAFTLILRMLTDRPDLGGRFLTDPIWIEFFGW